MRRLGLAARLSILITASVAGSALVVGIFGALAGSRFLMESAQEDLLHLVNDYADAIGLYFSGARSLLEATAPLIQQTAERAAEGQVSASEGTLADHVLSATSVFEYVILTDARGRVLLAEPASLSGRLSRPDIGFTSWFQEAIDRRATVVSDLWVSTVTQRPSVVIAVPLVAANGSILGVWAGGVQLARLSALSHGGAGRRGSAYGYVTDSRGLIVAHQERPEFVLAQTDYSAVPPVQEASLGREGTLQYVSPMDGISKLGAFLPLRMENEPDARRWTVSYAIPTTVSLQPVRTIAWTLGALAVFMGVVLAALSAIIIRRTLRPVGALANAAREMGAGNLAVRAPEGLRFELAELADSFNQMAVSVAASQETLRERAVSLERANTQLEAANRELESFSYSVSHDLRAPLRSIDGFSKAVLEDYHDLLDDEGKEYLGFLRESAQKMGHLIDDMLKLSRATRGELSHEEFDLSSAAEEIARDLARQNPERQVQFRARPGLTVQGDARLLRSVLQNLLENAWKFSRGRQPAIVELGSDVADGTHRFFVRDNGVGLDMHYADKLFQPFQRLHGSQEFEGTGVGLATVRRILARHGGRVWVESQLGKGTTVYFTM